MVSHFLAARTFPPASNMDVLVFRRVLLSIASAYRENRDDVSSKRIRWLARSRGRTLSAVRCGFFARSHYCNCSNPRLRPTTPAMAASGMRLSSASRRAGSADRPRRETQRRTHQGTLRQTPWSAWRAGGVYDQARGRVSSLFGRRALGGSALRENVLRQLGTPQELRHAFQATQNDFLPT